MHAVVVKVTINDPDAAQATLKERIVPMVSQAPGFVHGFWLAPDGNQAMSVVVFESEENAKGAAAQITPPPGGEVNIDSVNVREAIAHA